MPAWPVSILALLSSTPVEPLPHAEPYSKAHCDSTHMMRPWMALTGDFRDCKLVLVWQLSPWKGVSSGSYRLVGEHQTALRAAASVLKVGR